MILVFQLSRRAPDTVRRDVMFGHAATHNTQCAALLVMGLYDCVAVVSTTDADLAYQLTNTIEQPWYQDPTDPAVFATPQAALGCRSTSVGDVLVHADGRVLLCEPMGWQDLAAEVDALLKLDGRNLAEPGQQPVPEYQLAKWWHAATEPARQRLHALGYGAGARAVSQLAEYGDIIRQQGHPLPP